MAAVAIETDPQIEYILNALVAKWVADAVPLFVVLFKNNIVPTTASVYTDFTLATFIGAGPIAVDPTHFGAAVVAAHVASVTNSDTATWINGGADQQVFGYLLYNSTGNVLLAAETFANPQTISTGAQLGVQPVIRQQSGP